MAVAAPGWGLLAPLDGSLPGRFTAQHVAFPGDDGHFDRVVERFHTEGVEYSSARSGGRRDPER